MTRYPLTYDGLLQYVYANAPRVLVADAADALGVEVRRINLAAEKLTRWWQENHPSLRVLKTERRDFLCTIAANLDAARAAASRSGFDLEEPLSELHRRIAGASVRRSGSPSPAMTASTSALASMAAGLLVSRCAAVS
jgi:hypothetical protein